MTRSSLMAFVIHAAAAFFACIFAPAVALARAVEGYVDRALAFAFDILGRRDRAVFREGFGGFLSSPPLIYDGPAVHELRHEAGVSRRAAARNV